MYTVDYKMIILYAGIICSYKKGVVERSPKHAFSLSVSDMNFIKPIMKFKVFLKKKFLSLDYIIDILPYLSSSSAI